MIMIDIAIMLILAIAPADASKAGWATWYGNGDFHGNITATGEIFRPLALGCASRTLPLNSYVIVYSERTGSFALCRVNDRGPYGALLPSGEWVIMYKKKGVWYTRHKDGVIKTWDKKPGEYRGIMDLSLGTARVLYRTFERPPNGNIRIFYWRPSRE